MALAHSSKRLLPDKVTNNRPDFELAVILEHRAKNKAYKKKAYAISFNGLMTGMGTNLRNIFPKLERR